MGCFFIPVVLIASIFAYLYINFSVQRLYIEGCYIVKVFINRHTAIGNRRIAYQRNLAATLYVFV